MLVFEVAEIPFLVANRKVQRHSCGKGRKGLEI